MHALRHMLSTIFGIIFLLLLCFIPLPANSTALSLDVTIGFNDHFKLNAWTPITVVLENRGRPLSGTLEVIVTSGSEYQQDVHSSTYALDVELPNNSKKRYAFAVLIKTVTHDLVIRLSREDNILISKSVNLRSYFTEKNLVVVADHFVSPDILSVLPEDLHAVNVPPKFLPDSWYGYDGVDLLIMKADTIRGLRSNQFQALSRWLKQGGYLLTTGGLNYGALFSKRIQELLPLSVHGHEQLSGIQALARFCNQPLIGIEPFLVLRVHLDDAEVLVREGDIPIVVQKTIAYGKIVFLSFDYDAPPFSRWNGRAPFWDKILMLKPSIEQTSIDVADQKILDSMSAIIPTKFPAFKFALVFIGVYLIGLRFFVKIIREPGKARWKNSFALLIMIIVFTAIGYRGFFHPNHQQKIAYNSFGRLNLSGRLPSASLKYIIGLYAIKNSAYRLDFSDLSDPVTPVVSLRSRSKTPVPYILQQNHNRQTIVGTLNKWSHSFYKIDLNFFVPIDGYANRDDRHLTISIDNRMPYDIVNCLVYFKKRFVFVEQIKANYKRVIKLELSELKKTEIFNEHDLSRIIDRQKTNGTSSYLQSSQETVSEDLLREIHARYKSAPNRLIFVGWMQGGVISPRFLKSEPKGENLTLVNWELPVELTL